MRFIRPIHYKPKEALNSFAMNYIIIDQGTSSTKGFLFNSSGKILHRKRIKCVLKKPEKFHAESNPEIILKDIKELFQKMVNLSGSSKIKYTGISIQRSTFLFWEKSTCRPVTPAISWQDCRANDISENLKSYKSKLWSITGTPLNAHYGGPKFLHMLKNHPSLEKRIKKGELYFGSLSAFLTHAITGTAAIDESIACRSLFYNIHKGTWSRFALDLFQVPENCLPPIVPVKHSYGKMFSTNISLSIVIGDQQAALIGHKGLQKKSIATNFGTSGSIQYNVGEKLINVSGLISSVLYSDREKKVFMIEGTINGCNSLFYHLEERLGISHKNMQWNERAKLIKTEGIFIPGFNGLAAPYWKDGFDDLIINIGSNPNEIIRAAMESIGFLMDDILNCIASEGIKLPKTLTASGGGAKSTLLQFIADVTGININRSLLKDKTAIGVYRLLSGDGLIQIPKGSSHKVYYPESILGLNIKKDVWRKNTKKLLGPGLF